MTSYNNETKNASTFTKEKETIPPAKFDKAKFGKSRFDKKEAGSGQKYTNETKN